VSDQLRREIIHQLAARKDGIAYSELTKELPDSLLEAIAEPVHNEHTTPELGSPSSLNASIEEILNAVSKFKYPEGTGGHGTYHLLDKYYAEVDVWFWHYSRNQREEVEEILKEKIKAAKKNGAEETFIVPKIAPLQPFTGFDRLINIVHSPIFHRFVFFALWNMTYKEADVGRAAKTDDLILSEVIYLLMVSFEVLKSQPLLNGCSSFTSEQLTFVTNAVSVPVEVPHEEGRSKSPTTLLELILDLVDRAAEDNIKEHSKSLRYLVGAFETYSDEKGRIIISGWRDKSNWKKRQTSDMDIEDVGLSEQEKKKLAAKKRQAAIMAQFAQAQER
jgi:hypothetical protein